MARRAALRALDPGLRSIINVNTPADLAKLDPGREALTSAATAKTRRPNGDRRGAGGRGVSLIPFFWSTTFFTDDHLLLAFARYTPNPLAAFRHDLHGGEFYRPLSMSLWWLQARVGGGTIWPFAVVAAALHALVACQVAGFARALGGDGATALCAGAFFWLSPETREAALWFAAFPDLLGTVIPRVSSQDGLLAEFPRPEGKVLFAAARELPPWAHRRLGADFVPLYGTRLLSPDPPEGDLVVLASGWTAKAYAWCRRHGARGEHRPEDEPGRALGRAHGRRRGQTTPPRRAAGRGRQRRAH